MNEEARFPWGIQNRRPQQDDVDIIEFEPADAKEWAEFTSEERAYREQIIAGAAADAVRRVGRCVI